MNPDEREQQLEEEAMNVEPTQATELELIKQEADAVWAKFREASDISTKLGNAWVEANNRYKAALYDAVSNGNGAAAKELRKLDASMVLTK